ncbi:CCAAT/enhancer-binding protein gamma isoform X2 [Syngnathus typhle]|uniref:CCAAT/enhancer-binding protein gamma isoform X2 n=2 Tax=Syngnathus typhle TaxID=161592 RepID=UPI002A6AB9B3|nr:CCAAT/enhancer-binding protein gamma isoform X2 [Syngnathus typhle]
MRTCARGGGGGGRCCRCCKASWKRRDVFFLVWFLVSGQPLELYGSQTLAVSRYNVVPVFSRRSAVTQMSQPPQPKATSSDHNGVSVIQSQSHAAGAASALLQQVPQPSPLSQASSPGAGKAAPGKMKKASADKDSDEYRQRRERNNLAVKKSRQRSKQKAMDTQQRVNQLKEENERLEAKIKLLSKELSVLKDLFLEHAHNLADNVQPPSGNPEASPAPNNQ